MGPAGPAGPLRPLLCPSRCGRGCQGPAQAHRSALPHRPQHPRTAFCLFGLRTRPPGPQPVLRPLSCSSWSPGAGVGLGRQARPGDGVPASCGHATPTGGSFSVSFPSPQTTLSSTGCWAPGPPSCHWDVPEPRCPATTWCNRSNCHPGPKGPRFHCVSASEPQEPGPTGPRQGRPLSCHQGSWDAGFLPAWQRECPQWSPIEARWWAPSPPLPHRTHVTQGLAVSSPALKALSWQSTGPEVISVALGHPALESRALRHRLCRPLPWAGGPAPQTAGAPAWLSRPRPEGARSPVSTEAQAAPAASAPKLVAKSN